MKTFMLSLMLLSLFATSTLTACGGADTNAAHTTTNSTQGGDVQLNDQGDTQALDFAAGLQFMREEEKVAHDVYATLGARYGLQIFLNIKESEATHTEAVRQLLVTYGIEDPAKETPIGVFEDPALQAIYDKLVAQGEQSEDEALRVGAYIEEHDIMDLDERLAADLPDDVAAVYQNLRKGSTNHLQAFVRNIERGGGSYSPQLLSEAEYQEALGN